ncbi:uncharacterized protein EAF01_003488 [Botrytis porri]|uniref:Uncharacterized protein n=1 Tax=Botrytis porri TaxID=87229 RepID=A0A4Z1K591_9HELO|nr:uncharacterized protein EAF01_003488 [Botrytis porri]KAF7909770.1 hypothetical protein EAF01_003488 [Botrytis porri]TGO80818.1 hypothetical protein BPOR_1686g00020 [Botrytis porri]
MPLLKITSASFPPFLAGTRDVYTSPQCERSHIKVRVTFAAEFQQTSEALASDENVVIPDTICMHWLPHTSLRNRASISKSSTKRECLNGSSNRIYPTLRKRTGQTSW